MIDAEARELHWNYTLQLKKNGRDAARKWIDNALRVTRKRFGSDEAVRVEMRRLERERQEREEHTREVQERLLESSAVAEVPLDAERLE